jgi:hypothetical protein
VTGSMKNSVAMGADSCQSVETGKGANKDAGVGAAVSSLLGGGDDKKSADKKAQEGPKVLRAISSNLIVTGEMRETVQNYNLLNLVKISI